MRRNQCKQRSICVKNVCLVPSLLWLFWWGCRAWFCHTAGCGPGWAGGWCHQALVAESSASLLPKMLQSKQLTQTMKGKEAISPVHCFHTSWNLTKSHRLLSFLDRVWSFWVKVSSSETLTLYFMVPAAPQRSQCFEPKTKVCLKGQVSFCLPTRSLVLPTSTLCLPWASYRGPEKGRE